MRGNANVYKNECILLKGLEVWSYCKDAVLKAQLAVELMTSAEDQGM
jgi:hypothetical protein